MNEQEIKEWIGGLEGVDQEQAKALWQEIENLRMGLVESIQSEDYNRHLRWQAEASEDRARAAQHEAEDWAIAVAWLLFRPMGPLDLLKLQKRLDESEAHGRYLETELNRIRWANEPRTGDDDEDPIWPDEENY